MGINQEFMIEFLDKVNERRTKTFRERNSNYSREANQDGLSNFTEVDDICKILGLEFGDGGYSFGMSMVVLKMVRDINMHLLGMETSDAVRIDDLDDSHNYLDLAIMCDLQIEIEKKNKQREESFCGYCGVGLLVQHMDRCPQFFINEWNNRKIEPDKKEDNENRYDCCGGIVGLIHNFDCPNKRIIADSLVNIKEREPEKELIEMLNEDDEEEKPNELCIHCGINTAIKKVIHTKNCPYRTTVDDSVANVDEPVCMNSNCGKSHRECCDTHKGDTHRENCENYKEISIDKKKRESTCTVCGYVESQGHSTTCSRRRAVSDT